MCVTLLSLVDPKSTKIYVGIFVSGSLKTKKYVPSFPRPSGPKQNLTCLYFPSAWFLKKYMAFVLLRLTAPTYIRVLLWLLGT